MGLEALGWTDDRTAELAAAGAGLEAARMVSELRGLPQVSSGGASFAAAVGGGLRHRAGVGDLPTIGDWLAVRRPTDGPATIVAVLPRRSTLVRLGTDGRTRLLAANVDLAVVVMGLDGDYNLRRLERYLALCAGAGVAPAIVLSKADLGDPTARLAEIRAIAAAPVAALDLRDVAAARWLGALLAPGRTAVLLGSSGVGKSTLTNRLLGEDRQRTGEVRAHDDRGQHTTTHRQLFALPSGALLIDTPGLRTLALESDEDLAVAFADIDALAAGCQFGDCRHAGEPGCAVVAAADRGALDAARLASFRKLTAERAGARTSGRPPRKRKR
jgi:ribosome biogenesis GTPase